MEKKLQEYLIMDNNGMIIEKTDNINSNICGYISDIIGKTRSILKSNDSVNSIEIFYENQTYILKDNCSTNLSITTLLQNK